jgi:hypothetical protein
MGEINALPHQWSANAIAAPTRVSLGRASFNLGNWGRWASSTIDGRPAHASSARSAAAALRSAVSKPSVNQP